MVFNLMSFLGGAAGAGSKALEQKRANEEAAVRTTEQRQWQIATEGRADARTRKAKRDAKREEASGMLSTLTSLGYTVAQAESAVAGGAGSFAIYQSVGTKAFEAGEDVSELLELNNNSTTSVNDTLNGSTALPAKAQGLGAYKWNKASVATLFGTPPKAAKSVDLQLAQNAADQLRLLQGIDTETSSQQMAALKEAETFLISKLASVAEATRENTSAKSPVTVTNHATLETIITKTHAAQTKQYGLGYDAETNLEIAFEGNEGSGYSALLNSVYTMENSIGKIGDAWVSTRLTEERLSVERGLNRHGSNIFQSSGTDSTKVKQFATFTEYQNAITSGVITNQGEVSSVAGKPFIYTGVPSVTLDGAPPIWKVMYDMGTGNN